MTSSKRKISAEGAPAAIGPYSQAVQCGGMLYASGQIALDPAAGTLVQGGIREQTDQVIQNIRAVLGAAGCGLGDVVKTTVFLQDMGDFAAMNEVYSLHMGADGAIPPARSTVQVARLPKDALVEIEVIASVPQGG